MNSNVELRIRTSFFDFFRLFLICRMGCRNSWRHSMASFRSSVLSQELINLVSVSVNVEQKKLAQAEESARIHEANAQKHQANSKTHQEFHSTLPKA